MHLRPHQEHNVVACRRGQRVWDDARAIRPSRQVCRENKEEPSDGDDRRRPIGLWAMPHAAIYARREFNESSTNRSEITITERDAIVGRLDDRCNINFFSNRVLPVIFHSVKGYDPHLIIKQACEINNEALEQEYRCHPKLLRQVHGLLNRWSQVHWLLLIHGVIAWEARRETYTTRATSSKNFTFMQQNYPQQTANCYARRATTPRNRSMTSRSWTTKDCHRNNHSTHRWNKNPLPMTNTQHAHKVYDQLKCNTFKDYHMTYLKVRCPTVGGRVRRRSGRPEWNTTRWVPQIT